MTETRARCASCNAAPGACDIWRTYEGFGGCCSGCADTRGVTHDPATTTASVRFHRSYDAADKKGDRWATTPTTVLRDLEHRRHDPTEHDNPRGLDRTH
jgi:hypothetical protein